MKARTGAGFTLIEVLVALAIVAVALIASVRAIGVMAASGADLQSRLLAQQSADNRLALLHATRAFPPTGRSSEPCPQGELALVCEQEVGPTPNNDFRRVRIRVIRPDAGDHALAELAAVLPREP